MHLLYVVLDDGGFGWLDREARRAGVELCFRRAGDGPVQRSTEPGTVLQVTERADVVPVLTQGLSRARTGRATVVRVHCDPDDVPAVLVDDGEGAL